MPSDEAVPATMLRLGDHADDGALAAHVQELSCTPVMRTPLLLQLQGRGVVVLKAALRFYRQCVCSVLLLIKVEVEEDEVH